MICVVLSHQELSGNPQYAVIALVCVTLCTSVHFVHMEQKITSTTPQHNLKHNRAPCPTAPSAHASYKGYGCNNVKPPRPPPRNTLINIVVLGCGPIRTSEGAVAPFIGVHILGEIRPAGGFDTLAESRWEDRIGPSIVVQKINHTTINRQGPLYVRRIGRLLSWPKKSTIPQSTVVGLFMFGDWPCDGTAALFVATEIKGNI